jgi:hypothetical protein
VGLELYTLSLASLPTSAMTLAKLHRA